MSIVLAFVASLAFASPAAAVAVAGSPSPGVCKIMYRSPSSYPGARDAAWEARQLSKQIEEVYGIGEIATLFDDSSSTYGFSIEILGTPTRCPRTARITPGFQGYQSRREAEQAIAKSFPIDLGMLLQKPDGSSVLPPGDTRAGMLLGTDIRCYQSEREKPTDSGLLCNCSYDVLY